jgi:hypothetical protein
MTSATPPSPFFNGIVYNPSFFTTTTGTYLNYPIAQGSETFKNITFTHVYRQYNKLADKLANDAMDSGMNSNINDKNKNITK